jgi:hypothetical protein
MFLRETFPPSDWVPRASAVCPCVLRRAFRLPNCGFRILNSGKNRCLTTALPLPLRFAFIFRQHAGMKNCSHVMRGIANISIRIV